MSNSYTIVLKNWDVQPITPVLSQFIISLSRPYNSMGQIFPELHMRKPTIRRYSFKKAGLTETYEIKIEQGY